MHSLILIVEDDDSLREGLCAALASDELLPIAAGSVKEARELALSRRPELALLDCNLPDGSGLTLCPELAAMGIPSIFLTVRDGELDEVAALRCGAVDYIKKPFSLMVLRERIMNALRRSRSGADYADADCRFDFARQEFLLRGEPISLGATEQRLLACLIENRGRIVTRAALCERLWGTDGDFIDENALSVAVSRLRSKLGETRIMTYYGLGYMWRV